MHISPPYFVSGLGNQLKTAALMSFLTVLVILIGSALGGSTGMVIAAMLALVMNGGSYWFSDKIAIAMTRSQPLAKQDNPELYAMVEKLSQNAGLPMPKLYLTPSQQPNAFATGRNPANSAVAVTEGLLHILNRNELEGVIAHELAHIKNRDVLITNPRTYSRYVSANGRLSFPGIPGRSYRGENQLKQS